MISARCSDGANDAAGRDKQEKILSLARVESEPRAYLVALLTDFSRVLSRRCCQSQQLGWASPWCLEHGDRTGGGWRHAGDESKDRGLAELDEGAVALPEAR